MENQEDEFKVIVDLIEKYNYVAMDTEYPGIYSAFQADNMNKESGYRFIKSNVDQLKQIQVGITLCDENGDTPSPIATWQFNFKFNISADKYVADSINLLKEAGIDFKALNEFGINPVQFAELLLSSGLVLNEHVTWITFHGSFDFAYLTKCLLNTCLPGTMDQFMDYMRLFFPTIYDLKIIVSELHDLKNGSQSKLAIDLDLKRTGNQHQAGSDAHLTLLSFFKIRKNFFKEGFTAKIINKIYGLSNETGIYHQTVYTGADAQNNYVYQNYYQQFYPNYYYNDAQYQYYGQGLENTQPIYYNGTSSNYSSGRLVDFQQPALNVGIGLNSTKTAQRPPKTRNLIN